MTKNFTIPLRGKGIVKGGREKRGIDDSGCVEERGLSARSSVREYGSENPGKGRAGARQRAHSNTDKGLNYRTITGAVGSVCISNYLLGNGLPIPRTAYSR